MRETDEKLSHESPLEPLISEEAWLMAVASDLGLPNVWVRGRWELVQEEAERNEELKSKAGRHARGQFPTDSAESAQGYARQEDLKSKAGRHARGQFPTNSAESTQEEPSREGLASGQFPTNSALLPKTTLVKKI